ncbi:response regulator transcription factor [Pseudoduganella umbonata]|uniref:CheY-like chemotaxis protein n=1 Tax=Pseudoduganella umbonata TaxID=864828 RepID=A0A4P8HNN2_9BURK|nr:response regulator transcription factor [Pseudoduganella umbonata]MBB3221523.1 CheY-like chemotaxis protein [Pseudoduganella umbonata]QCP10666.1 response regulator transcription factor [Pseudoduganella umbonata]
MTTASLITPFKPGDRVLVASADHAMAEALARTFGNAGFSVRTAFDGVAALDKARTFFPTAAVLGLDLRYLDGFQLARALRTIPGCARMRVLALLPPAIGLLDRHRCFDYVLRTPRMLQGARPMWVVDAASLGIRPTLLT